MGIVAVFPNRFSLTSGVSDMADYIDETMGKVLLRYFDTATGEQDLDVFDRLEAARLEFEERNTDGYGADSIDLAAYERAWQLAGCLPLGLQEPEIVVEPDGDVALEWANSQQRVLVVSLDANRVLRYAGMFGTSSTDGREYFDGRFPREIARLVSRVFEVAA